MSDEEDDFYRFDDDSEEPAGSGGPVVAGPPWKILMVDDSPEVHQVTRLVLRSVTYLGRPMEFHSAYSGAEGRQLVRDHPDAAMVFLDVVMETDHAGLDMARYIREELGNKLIRIVLRTGQPGQAPETEVIQRYDINDYKCKAELSHDRLLTTLIVALRCYSDLLTIETSRKGLEQILASSTELLREHSTENFLTGLLKQIQAMFDLGRDAILCARSRPNTASPKLPEPVILAGSGHYETLIGNPLGKAPTVDSKADILKAFETGHGFYAEGHYSIYFYSRDVFEIVILFEAPRAPNPFDDTLINVFCNTAAVALSNIHLMETLEQKVVERTDALSKANVELTIMATTDMLTNVHNRRHLFELGSQQLQIAQRYKRPLSTIILDVDHFKAINDTYGHAVGDQVLRAIAKTCLAVLRTADIFGRYGGEEFVAFCPETDLAGGLVTAERLRKAIAELHHEGLPEGQRVTASFGVTDTAGDNDITRNLQRADRALYEAKGNGRNRVVANPGV